MWAQAPLNDDAGTVPLHDKDTAQSPHATGDKNMATQPLLPPPGPHPAWREGAATQPLCDHHDVADPLHSNNNTDTQSPCNHHLGPKLLHGNDDMDTQPPCDNDTMAAMTSTPP